MGNSNNIQSLRIVDNKVKELTINPPMVKFLDKIANKSLKEIAKENPNVFVFPDDLIKDNSDDDNSDDCDDKFILKMTKNESKVSTLQTGNILGFLGGTVKYRNSQTHQQLIIGSRFDAGEKDYFLLYMLARSLKIPFVHSFKSTVSQERVWEYYNFIFVYYLREAMKKGPYKTYINKQYNDANVKGIIDVKRHIARNIPFVGKIAYNQKEFSYDNHLTQLIRHTMEFIKSRYGNGYFSSIKSETEIIKELTPSYCVNNRNKVIQENKRKIVKNNYFSGYYQLQKLCLAILEHTKIWFGGNSENKAFGVLFNGSWIWEEYINTLIKEKFYHPQNTARIGTQYLFCEEGETKRFEQKIYPDFIGKENQAIADAKYKPIGNIKRDDYFQVLSYMFRFDATTGYYLYPEKDVKNNDKEYEILRGIDGFGGGEAGTRDKKNKLRVIKHGLKIAEYDGNSEESFNEFEKAMKKNEEDFLNIFNEKVSSEAESPTTIH